VLDIPVSFIIWGTYHYSQSCSDLGVSMTGPLSGLLDQKETEKIDKWKYQQGIDL